MPERNGTGPMGADAMTGRGFGACIGAEPRAKDVGLGLGMACRRGFGRGFRWFSADEEKTVDDRKEFLQAQRDALRNRLAAIDKQLKSL